jgi:hypothetical protein
VSAALPLLPVANLKYDGKTTGEQAAVQILGAEKKKLGGIAADLRADDRREPR